MTERLTDPKIVEQQEQQHAERIARQCDGVCNTLIAKSSIGPRSLVSN